MNQIQKRLNIIKLAISLTDLETIQLQILRLSSLKGNTEIEDIMTLLQSGGYGQAQALITDYIETASTEVHQRSAKVNTSSGISEEDQATIDEFQLFITPTVRERTETPEVSNDSYSSEEKETTKEECPVDYDALLKLNPDDVLNNAEEEEAEEEKEDDLFDAPSDEKEDVFFDLPSAEPTDTPLDDEHLEDNFLEDNFFEKEKEKETIEEEAIEDDQTTEETTNSSNNIEIQKIEDIEEEDIFSISIPEKEEEKEEDFLSYSAIPYISQKLISIKKQYPITEEIDEKFDSVEALLTKIAQDGYTEIEMEEMIEYIGKLTENEKYAEASQLLLVCGATESKFAQFMLARELYSGLIFVKNIQESFTLMSILADSDYPEALCDLGQFYENGIGTQQDISKAKELYAKALDLGIKRAKKHCDRLEKN